LKDWNKWNKYLVSILIDWNPDLAARSWHKDLAQEDGFHHCNCCICHQSFYGHKTRLICKECDERQDLGIRDFVIAPQEFSGNPLELTSTGKN
jgi:hypothetical protein